MYPRKDFTLRVVLAALCLALWSGRAAADPLDPADFTSLGAFPTAAGIYTINTSVRSRSA